MQSNVTSKAARDDAGLEEERIAPEILAVIAAAATAMLGTNIRIRLSRAAALTLGLSKPLDSAGTRKHSGIA